MAHHGDTYAWKAVDQLESIEPKEFCIWHTGSGRLTVPSRRRGVPDKEIVDPYSGWTQRYEEFLERPWFGGNLPGPYSFMFKEAGTEESGSLGLSGFNWIGDHFRAVGCPADPLAKKWWQRLKRFVRANATAIPWPYPDGHGRLRAYAFPDAHEQILAGRPLDVNP